MENKKEDLGYEKQLSQDSDRMKCENNSSAASLGNNGSRWEEELRGL